MKFKDVELLPGVVIDCKDPKMIGRVKVTVPGLFDSTQMDKEGIPWVYPISMPGYQRFSKLQNGSKVWVFKQEGNYREFWYMPMFQLHEGTRNIVSEYEEPDVLLARSAGENSVYIYYTDKQGIMLKLGPDSSINIKPNGDILSKSGEGQVLISGGKVYIGKESPNEPAVLGNQLYDLLSQLASDLQTLSSKAGSSPYTSTLVEPFATASTNVTSKLKNILAERTIVS